MPAGLPLFGGVQLPPGIMGLPGGIGGGGGGGGGDAAAASLASEPEVRAALDASRRVGALLLKAEERETAALATAADELLKREFRCVVCVVCGRGFCCAAGGWPGVVSLSLSLSLTTSRVTFLFTLLLFNSVPVRAVPCQPERDACVDCYARHKEGAWRCADLVDAYASCAAAAYERVTSSSGSGGRGDGGGIGGGGGGGGNKQQQQS